MQYSGRDTIFDFVIQMNLKKLNHISIGCASGTLSFRVNGMPSGDHNTILNIRIREITMGFEELGILSLYGRQLSKSEIVQNFIDYHVKNFTNDELLNYIKHCIVH